MRPWERESPRVYKSSDVWLILTSAGWEVRRGNPQGPRQATMGTLAEAKMWARMRIKEGWR